MSLTNATLISESVLGTVVAALITARAQALAMAQSFSTDLALASSFAGPFKVPQYYYDGFPVWMTAKTQEAYTFQSDMTENVMEDASVTSDHVILKPIRLELNFEVCNIDGLGSNALMATRALEAAINVWKSRQPFTLMTTHKLLENMVCVGLSPENEADKWGALSFRASFKQANYSTVQTVPYNPANVYGAGINTQLDTSIYGPLSRVQPPGPANGGSVVPSSFPTQGGILSQSSPFGGL